MLLNQEMFQQKLAYIHNNRVEAGFVENPTDWSYISSRCFYGKKGVIELLYIL